MKRTLLAIAGVLAFVVTSSLYAQTSGGPKLIPGTKSNVLSSITGKATDSVNGAVQNALVRLRDVRTGHIVATTITDKAGQFEFKSVDVGSYIVEMMGPSSDIVVASSLMMHVGSGELLSTLLRVPFGGPAFASIVGNAAPATLQAVTTAAQAIAAASGSTNTPAQSTSGEPATTQNMRQLR